MHIPESFYSYGQNDFPIENISTPELNSIQVSSNIFDNIDNTSLSLESQIILEEKTDYINTPNFEKIVCENGAVYEGYILDKKANRFGCMTYPSKERYIGEWINGKKNGKGFIYLPNGEYFYGDWVNDKAEGQGELKYENDLIYIGGIKNGRKDGYGQIYFSNGVSYKGFFKDNLITGDGIQ